MQALSTSSQGARGKLLDLVTEGVRTDPDMEASLRELAGSAGSEVDIRTILGQLSTRSLREAYENLQGNKEKQYASITEQ